MPILSISAGVERIPSDTVVRVLGAFSMDRQGVKSTPCCPADSRPCEAATVCAFTVSVRDAPAVARLCRYLELESRLCGLALEVSELGDHDAGKVPSAHPASSSARIRSVLLHPHHTHCSSLNGSP